MREPRQHRSTGGYTSRCTRIRATHRSGLAQVKFQSGMSVVWVGGGEGSYEDPIPQLTRTQDPCERRHILEPFSLIEVGTYGRDNSPRGFAICWLRELHIIRDRDGHYATGKVFAVDSNARHLVWSCP